MIGVLIKYLDKVCMSILRKYLWQFMTCSMLSVLLLIVATKNVHCKPEILRHISMNSLTTRCHSAKEENFRMYIFHCVCHAFACIVKGDALQKN